MIINEDKKKIIEELNNGKVIAIKTDTVYGLICNALNVDAINKIYSIKRRENKKPIAIFVKSIDEIKKYVDENEITNNVVDIMKKYWPGALTIIFNKKKDVLNHITSGMNTIGIRIPNDSFLLSILENISYPLAETSCNISGEKEYTNPNMINEKIGSEIDFIVDGGMIKKNAASTVIKINNNDIQVIRQGDIKIDE